MNGSCTSTEPTLCGCCEGIATETPELIYNRPGLSAISYRVGTHNAFLASLLAALSSSEIPPWAPLTSGDNSDPTLVSFNPAVALSPLRTRDVTDFSIALLDAWATSLDILSFYQERIANELYLRTAVDAASVMDLAQLVGYKPSPGVAAFAYLAFTLNNAPGSPDNVLIPAGSRVQSVPGPGQQPQVFETSSDLTAVIAQNAILPQTTIPWGLSNGIQSIWLQGISNNINVGDAILFVNQALYTMASTGTTSGTPACDFHFVTAVTTNPTSGNTLVQWDRGLNWPTSNDNTASIYVFRKKAALFGVQAPDPRTLSTNGNNIGSLGGYPPGGNGDWVFQANYIGGSSQINLDASYPGAAPQTGQPAWTVLSCPHYTAVFQVTAAVDTGPLLYTLASKTTQLTLANEQVLADNFKSAANVSLWAETVALAAMELEIAIIEGNGLAQAEVALALATANLVLAEGSGTSDMILSNIVGQTRSATAYIQSAQLIPADTPIFSWPAYDGIYARQAGLITPVEGSSLTIVTGQQLASGQTVAISGQRLRLQVAASFSAAADTSAGFVPAASAASLPLMPGQTFLIAAFPPVASGTDMEWSVLTTDGVTGTLHIGSASILLIPAAKSDPVTGETATIGAEPDVNGPVVTLTFTQALSGIYDRGTVSVNSNVVGATNGETMYELLGSGDGTNPTLEFQLKQSPLTYVSSTLNNGAVSTLQVWVNNMRWHEVDNFLDSASTDRAFTTSADATGKVTVQFGDGQEGSRTPTGQMNIRANYRKGIGSAGNVASGQLSQALDRPQGLASVSNPDAGTGGADPDTAADARASAPLHVLTLDRVVSLEDYQNYALAFAGIAKALATWTWVGRQRAVFLSVAGANGSVFESGDLTITNLLTSLKDAGNPFVPVYVAAPSYNSVNFEVGANLQIDTADYDPTQVIAQVWQSLSMAFSFAQRQIGQGVAQSEVIAVIQQTPGVIAVEMTIFSRQGEPASSPLSPVLLAASPTAGQQGTPAGAELLTIDPASQGNFEAAS